MDFRSRLGHVPRMAGRAGHQCERRTTERDVFLKIRVPLVGLFERECQETPTILKIPIFLRFPCFAVLN